MHLIETLKFTLHEFQGSSIPDYAILSHRWDSEEVSFLDLKSGKGRDMVGFGKIEGCCAQAASEGWEYAWIDSCCIDKSSSAELSEAINSMFRWYQDAQVCYAYLSDVPGGDEDPSSAGSAFRNSKWFTRGWTLQELLAPSTVVFYNHDWIDIGTKSSLYDLITSITGIRPLANYADASIAQKMSWASQRETTREEDIAYCLMGLFGVNMPPLYGEGENAFMRLQLEILSKSADESIFAWKAKGEGGLLAQSPASFRESGDIRQVTDVQDRPPFAMTNKGLRIELLLLSPSDVPEYIRQVGPDPVALAPLNCSRHNGTRFLALGLEKRRNQWYRAVNGLLEWNGACDSTGKETDLVYIPQHDKNSTSRGSRESSRKRSFFIKVSRVLASGFPPTTQREASQHSRCVWKTEKQHLTLTLNVSHTPLLRGLTTWNYGAVPFVNKMSDERFVLILEADDHHNVGLDIIVAEGTRPLRRVLNYHYETQPVDKQYVRQDRVSKILHQSGLLVSAVMRKERVLGERLHVVDIDIKQASDTAVRAQIRVGREQLDIVE